MPDNKIDEAYDKLLDLGKSNDVSDLDKTVNDIKNILGAVDNLKSNQLTDENIEDILKVIREETATNDDLKAILDMPSNNGILETGLTDEGFTSDEEKIFTHDPITGSLKEEGALDDFETSDAVSLDDILDDETNGKIDEIVFTLEDISPTIMIMLGNLDQDLKPIILDLMNRYQHGEQLKYNEMPANTKSAIYKICLNNAGGNKITKSLLNFVTNNVFDEITTDIVTRRYQIEFDQALADINRDSVKDLSDIYSDMITNKKNNMYEIGDKVKETNPEKAEIIYKIGDACEESYTLNKFKDVIINHKIKLKKYDLDDYLKIFSYFNHKYDNSRFNIRDIHGVPHTLQIYLPSGITNDDIVLFTILFCKYCVHYKPENIDEHTFMYYVISNIYALNMKTDEIETQFQLDFIDTICNVISSIKESYNEFVTVEKYDIDNITSLCIDSSTKKVDKEELKINEPSEEKAVITTPFPIIENENGLKVAYDKSYEETQNDLNKQNNNN